MISEGKLVFFFTVIFRAENMFDGETDSMFSTFHTVAVIVSDSVECGTRHDTTREKTSFTQGKFILFKKY